MQFTGTSQISLPQVSVFNFSLTGVKVSDTGLVNFRFLDTGGNSFAFALSGGYVITDRIISTYNVNDEVDIVGYLGNGILNYSINGTFNQKATTFTKLNSCSVSAGTTTVLGDLMINSNPITCSTSFSSTYNCYGTLTGAITSDTPFLIKAPTLLSYSSNKNLLQNNYTGIFVGTGTTTLTFSDIDDSFFEYQNDILCSFPTSFGDIGGQFSSYRGGITTQNTLSLSDSDANNYYQASPFNGFWSGKFIYSDNPSNYNLGFSFSNKSYIGDDYPSVISVMFQPIYPTNGSQYTGAYVTGFSIVSGGCYQTPPTPLFSEYFYVTGLQKTMESFLFSTGCTNQISVTFSGGSPVSQASGKLFLKNVNISGLYGGGIVKYSVVSGYSGISNGSSYRSTPVFVLATGGGCYSVPNFTGAETYQFKFASGYGATYSQADGLTGIVLCSGTGAPYNVTGIQITNIGFGYNSSYPASVSFVRASGDIYSGSGNASGVFYSKSTGLYNFTDFWGASTNFENGFSQMSGFNGYYSGNYPVNGAGDMTIALNCSGLDNTVAVSGLLTVVVSGNGSSVTGKKIVYQSRTFSLDTGYLFPNSVPVDLFSPLVDLNSSYGQSQFEIDYLNNLGNGANIIKF